MNRLLLALGILPLAAASGFCGASSFGELMQTEPSVRAAAMANAYTAEDGDVLGSYYNPAQSVESRTLGAMFQRGYADDSTGAFAYSVPKIYKGINIGAALLYYNAGDIDLYTDDGSMLTMNAEKDWMGTLNFSRQFGEHISAGANVKLAHESLFDTTSDSTFLFDMGVLAKYPLMNVGFAWQNLGGAMTLGDQKEVVPSTWRLGAARAFTRGQDVISASCDLVHNQDTSANVRMGGEYLYRGMAAFRAGYEFSNGTDDATTLNFGFGLMFKGWSFDYAMVPYRTLGTTHRFGISYKM